MSKTTFICDNCGTQAAMWTCWFIKRKNHYCSRPCKDAHHKELYGSGLTKEEYLRQYWSRPENRARKLQTQRAARKTRLALYGESVKKEILGRARSRARARGIEFAASIDDFELPTICPALGVPLVISSKKGGEWNSPSLDRIDSTKGYIPGNLIVISKRANTIKCDATLDELEAVIAFMKTLRPPATR